MLDGACDDGGAAFGPIIGNVRCGGGDPLEYENFVSVSSELYPDLHGYYETRLTAYFESLREPEVEESTSEEYGGRPGSP